MAKNFIGPDPLNLLDSYKTEIFMDPKAFQEQIDSFKAGTDTIKEIEYKIENHKVRLQSVDKYIECIEEFNKTLQLFATMMEKDTQSMKLIRADWMNIDNELGTKTLNEILF